MHLKLQEITKRFGRQTIFKDISIDISPPESLAIKGSNGSGKSTLLKIILGVLSPSTGKVSVEQNGKAIEHRLLIRYVGFCSPYLNLYDHLSAHENVLFHLKGFNRKIDSEFIDHLFDFFQLRKARDKHLNTFSSGMIQRTRLIQAFASDPNMLLLDEPTATLDEKGKLLVQEYLMKVKSKKDKLLIIASNDNDDLKLCEHVIDIEKFKP